MTVGVVVGVTVCVCHDVCHGMWVSWYAYVPVSELVSEPASEPVPLPLSDPDPDPDPEPVRVHVHVRAAACARGVQAFADLEVATETSPNDPCFLFNRANAHLAVGDVDKAHADLDRSISITQSIPAYYHCRGVAFQAQNDKGRAMTNFEAALALNPK